MYMYACIHAFLCMHVRMSYMHVRIYVRMYVCMHAYIHVRVLYSYII